MQHVAAAPPAPRAVDDVASPPSLMVTTWLGPFGRRAGQRRPVLHPDPPSPGGRLPRHRGVPAQADKHPAAKLLRDPRGGPVGRPPLNRRPRSSWTPAGTVSRCRATSTRTDRHPGMTRTPTRPGVMTASGLSLLGPRQLSEVPVIAKLGKRAADGRVHVPVSQLRRPQGNSHGLGQQRANRHGDRTGRTPRDGADGHQLGVRPEPAARQVKGQQIRFEQFPGRRKQPGRGHHELDKHPQRRPGIERRRAWRGRSSPSSPDRSLRDHDAQVPPEVELKPPPPPDDTPPDGAWNPLFDELLLR